MARIVAMLTMLAALTTAIPAPVRAQEDDGAVPACELSGGYGFVHDFDLEENLPAGGYFSAAANINRWFALVGDVGVNQRTFREADIVSLTGTVVSGGVGPRFFSKINHFVPYGQVLAGATYARAEFRSAVFDTNSDETFFSLQPGAGMLVYFNHRVGAQIAVDYRWVDPFSDDGEDWSEFRFVSGVVVAFGSR